VHLTAWSLFGLQRIIMWEIPFLVQGGRDPIAVSFLFPLRRLALRVGLGSIACLTTNDRREFLKSSPGRARGSRFFGASVARRLFPQRSRTQDYPLYCLAGDVTDREGAGVVAVRARQSSHFTIW